MKILPVADLHYSLPQLDWVLRVASRYDLVILAGDLLDTQSSVTITAQMVAVQRSLMRLREVTKVLVCSGNHDLNHAHPSGERYARWIMSSRAPNLQSDGESLYIGEFAFAVFPWWDGEIAQAAIASQLATSVLARAEKWVWVYHAPPAEVPVSWSGRRHFGDESLSGWIRQYHPDMVFSGHVHEAPFSRGGSWVAKVDSTWIFNAGKQIGDVPTHIIVDTDRQEAVWFSVEAGAEIISLKAKSGDERMALMEMPNWIPLQDPSSSLGSPRLDEPADT
jgi:Icc-related predicted phosphoesterase